MSKLKNKKFFPKPGWRRGENPHTFNPDFKISVVEDWGSYITRAPTSNNAQNASYRFCQRNPWDKRGFWQSRERSSQREQRIRCFSGRIERGYYSWIVASSTIPRPSARDSKKSNFSIETCPVVRHASIKIETSWMKSRRSERNKHLPRLRQVFLERACCSSLFRSTVHPYWSEPYFFI